LRSGVIKKDSTSAVLKQGGIGYVIAKQAERNMIDIVGQLKGRIVRFSSLNDCMVFNGKNQDA